MYTFVLVSLPDLIWGGGKGGEEVLVHAYTHNEFIRVQETWECGCIKFCVYDIFLM